MDNRHSQKARRKRVESERNGQARSSPSSVGRRCLRERLLPFPNWENTNGKPFECYNGWATSSVTFPTWLRRKTPLGFPLPRTSLVFHYTHSSDFTALGIGLRTRYMMFWISSAMIAKCKAIAHGKTALEYIFRETKLKNKLLIQNLCGDTAERIYKEMSPCQSVQ